MGTYLEDYLESMYMLPSEIKRNFDLMRELDKTSYPLIDELTTFHKEYLTNARRKVVDRCANTELGEPDEAELRALVETDEILEKLREKHQRAVQKLDEKIAIAAQSYDIVDHHIRRLDQDLEAYAALLKQNGEFEDDKANAKKRKLTHSSSGDGLGLNKADNNTTKQELLTAAQQKSGSASTSSNAAAANAAAIAAAQQSTSSQQSSRKSGGAGGGAGRKRAAAEAVEVVIVPATVPMGAEDLPIDPNEPVYCHCRRVSYGQMVGCDNDDCKYEWFHFECVGLTDQPQGKWYCTDCKIIK